MENKIYDSEIEACLDSFCAEKGITNISKESQSIWNAALMYIKKIVFPDVKQLKSNTLFKNGIGAMSNCNAYNYELVDHICDIYIYLSLMNDKEVSINGFSYLTGISRDTIEEWGHNNKKLSNKAFPIYKKLVDTRLESLSGKLATGKQNPVGVIAILNHFYGWNSPYAPDANRHRTALSAAELPRLNEVKTVEIVQGTDRLTDSGNE
jgi:hypothetical protein